MPYLASLFLLPLSAVCLWIWSPPHKLASPLDGLWAHLGKIRKHKFSSSAVGDVYRLADRHETAAALVDLIQHDGASTWPPRSNHDHKTWPSAWQPYKLAYVELAPSLPMSPPSLDENSNMVAISDFRQRFSLLLQSVKLDEVINTLQAAFDGERDAVTLDTLNAFYSCISWCRHAYRLDQKCQQGDLLSPVLTVVYRWGIVPVVRVAQDEKEVHLPEQLVRPWYLLQNHYGCISHSGNVMSGLILNFDDKGRHVFKANTGLAEKVVSAEEEFARIFREAEGLVCRSRFEFYFMTLG